MSSISKALLVIGAVVFIVIILSNLNSNPNTNLEVSPSDFINQSNYKNYQNSTGIKPLDLETVEIESQPNCHPSYSGTCLNPNASDYDCAGGSGNGPYYTGRVRVVGSDVFGLDRDHDGWGCEK